MPHSVPKDEKAPRSHVPFWTADNLADTKEIPTYLFRLSTPRSDGETTETHVCPPEPQHENLLDLKRCVGADRLHKHLDWEREHKPICNFMSWSSSLLFLLQYAFFRHTNICDKFDDIKLLVIDTTKFPKGTFAKDMDLLKVFKTDCKPDCKPHNDIQAFVKRRNGRNYFGEYLTQGALNLFEGECIQASFKEMVDLGLFELLPEVLRNKQNWTGWANPVKTSRFAFSSNEYAQPISENEVDAAISIAKTLFKGPWSLPVATMLLGLKPRQRNDPIILRGFIDSYGVDIIRDTMSQGLIIDAERLPEVNEYGYIISEIALGVLGIDELESSDTDDSVNNESTAVDDLASDFNSQLTLKQRRSGIRIH